MTYYINNINSRLAGQGLSVANNNDISASDAWIKSLSSAQTSELAAVFKKMGKTVKDTKTLATLLIDYPEVTTAKDYTTGYNTLVSMLIPGAGGTTGNLLTQTVTQYTDDQLKEIANTVAQGFLKKNISDADWALVKPKLRALVDKGTTTTTQQVGGKNVVTVTPGFSQQAAQGIIEKQLGQTAQPDLQVKQYQDFADWLSQNMAGM